MKIAILGYGKMGRIIEKIAQDRKHEIVLKIDVTNQNELTTENLKKADVVIEFSTPATVLAHIDACFKAKVPVIVGTTGWYGHLQRVKNECEQSGNTLLYASNFSVGVNIFFHVNKMLAKLMNNYPYYDVQVEEIHHTQKLDSPSGTAITIAEDIVDGLDSKKEWVNILTSEGTEGYDSEVDSIEFKHTAHNRNGFALGAVLAAEWVQNKKGFYSAKDMFNFSL
jgi:4-hydroxy-tetrahydrodipicolinate reductase